MFRIVCNKKIQNRMQPAENGKEEEAVDPSISSHLHCEESILCTLLSESILASRSPSLIDIELRHYTYGSREREVVEGASASTRRHRPPRALYMSRRAQPSSSD
jgi:hypothetical protein